MRSSKVEEDIYPSNMKTDFHWNMATLIQEYVFLNMFLKKCIFKDFL